MLRLYFVKQFILVDGKPAMKKRLLAFYPSGLKFITKPSRDHFTPEHIFDMLEDATLIKFTEIIRFRFDSGKSECVPDTPPFGLLTSPIQLTRSLPPSDLSLFTALQHSAHNNPKM